MRSRLVTLLVAAVVALTSLAASPAPARADGAPVLQVTEFTGVGLDVVPNGGTQFLQASCPTGMTPLSGYVTSSAVDDLRRLFETFHVVDGGNFQTSIVNFGAQTRTVQAVVRCVTTGQLGTVLTASGTFDAASDHVAEGTVSCSDGWIPISASVTEPHSPDRTLLTSSPTADLSGWTARAWVGDPDDPTEVMTVEVNCIQKTRLPGIVGASNYDGVGWGAGATADCPTGLQPLYGGTAHVGGDRGAITVLAHPTGTGWASTTLSLSTGSMLTVVACVPAALPTISLSGSAGYTNQPSLSWSFSATDPAAAGGYSLGTVCQTFHPGTGRLPHPCTSPITGSGLADGAHTIRVWAETSDGRRSVVAEATVTVDTVAPTVTMSAPPIFPPTRSVAVAWTGADATTGIRGYDLRRRRTPLVGAISDWTTPVSTLALSRTYDDLAEGATYCFEVRATDRATNVGSWARRCTAIPVDDRSLSRSAGWSEVAAPGWLDDTALETTERGASVFRRATTRRVALTALTCPTCGAVAVLVGGTEVGRIDLSAPSTQRRLLTLPPFAVATGALVVKVVSDGKLVRIDSVSSSR
ncbi:hypothetical protein [Nocardioides sp. MH1]|uniref:hypothetical protein n=1 Tax=Nocardioides sp. MH1 TaxID=3242490 RepID=UPI003522D211